MGQSARVQRVARVPFRSGDAGTVPVGRRAVENAAFIRSCAGNDEEKELGESPHQIWAHLYSSEGQEKLAQLQQAHERHESRDSPSVLTP